MSITTETAMASAIAYALEHKVDWQEGKEPTVYGDTPHTNTFEVLLHNGKTLEVTVEEIS